MCQPNLAVSRSTTTTNSALHCQTLQFLGTQLHSCPNSHRRKEKRKVEMTTAIMVEASSPLAAMQPSYMSHCGFRVNAPPSFPPMGAGPFGPNSFNFKDLSMKRSHPDYFTMNPVRGSSPTASLAADLSQNFHIDQRYDTKQGVLGILLIKYSPQLPTPRRSLFAATAFSHHGLSHN